MTHSNVLDDMDLRPSFPTFNGGDVRIIISGSRQYLLHASVLKSGSPVLAEMLKDEYAASLSSKAIKRGVTARHRLIMVEHPKLNKEDDKIDFVLEPVALNEEGKPLHGSPIGLDLENGRIVPPIFIAFHAVLGAFYNVPINFGDFEKDPMVHILTNAMEITIVAEYLECIHIITKPIEATLLSLGQTLQQSIANNPTAWLDFAYRLQSRAIFREALIHGAGKYHTKEVQEAVPQLAPGVHHILAKKAEGLVEAMRKAQLNIVTYYPQHLQREKTVGRADKDSIGRASYSNDILSWMALVVFRHWAMEQAMKEKTHHSNDMGYEFVNTIMAAGDAYLDRPTLTTFHNHFPMSFKAAAVIENKLSEMKEHIKRFVSHLTKNESQLDVRRFPMNHLMCTVVDVRDYPWDTGFLANTDVLMDGDESEE